MYISDVFIFKVKHPTGLILGMVGPTHVKRKEREVYWLDTG